VIGKFAIFPKAGRDGRQTFVPANERARGKIIAETVVKKLEAARRAAHPFAAGSAVDEGNDFCTELGHKADFQILVLETVNLKPLFGSDKNFVG
jgi:hypothetical protein